MDDQWLDELLGETPEVSLSWQLYVDELIRTSCIPEDHKVEIERMVQAMAVADLYELTNYLRDNQPCPIDNALTYNQTDIKRKLTVICR